MPIDILTGLQWGDEGKGKIVDLLSKNYDIIARFQGGPNAGHTLVIDDQKFVFHSLPSGVINPQTINILGAGMVIDPETLLSELELLDNHNIDYENRILISAHANLILPTHKLLDRYYENKEKHIKIGSTLRGIGPAYKDKYGRIALRMGDIREKTFEKEYYALRDIHLEIIGDRDKVFASEEDTWFEAIEELRKQNIINTEVWMYNKLKEQKRILAEGAQGTLLDVSFGTYPFVTSSNTIAGAVCTGLGLGANWIENVYGVFKAYTTRVGEGPFPTEQNNEAGNTLMKAGCEYGSTTGRPRRCGWLDIPALKYAVMLNGVNKLIMSKTDVLSSLDEISVAVNYKSKRDNSTIDFPDVLFNKPYEIIYETLPSWKENINKTRNFEDLPAHLKTYIAFIEERIMPLFMISTGPDRKENILR
jgi:adenylosuccinate synthase